MSEVTATSTAPTSTDSSSGDGQSTENNQTQEQGESGTPSPAQVKALKKYKLQVDGQEMEAEIDLNDDEAVRKELQMSRAAKKRMGEAQAEKKKAFEIIKAFESDPESMLKRLGPKGREIAEKYLLAQINEEMLSPAEKELRDLKNENETYKQKEAREKAEREAKISAQKEYEFAQSFQNTIIQALEKSGMPKTPTHIKNLARLMSQNLDLGLDLSPQELADEWARERAQDYSTEFKDMSADQFVKLYGQDMANRLRKHAIKELQEKHSHLNQPGKKVESSGSSSQQSRPMTMDEWRDSVSRRIK